MNSCTLKTRLGYVKLAALMALPLILQASETLAEAPSPAVQKARQMVFNPGLNAITFQNMTDFYPYEEIGNEKKTWKLKRDPQDLNMVIDVGGESRSLEDALNSVFTNGIVVLHRGKIVYEKYFNKSDDSTHFVSFSMAKSITSMLVGAAIEQGKIEDVNDPLEKYLPELKGTAYEGVSIRNALLMRSGVDFDESYRFDQPSHLSYLFDKAMVSNEVHFWDFSALDLKGTGEQGRKFNYSTLETAILGKLVSRATGKRLAEFTEEVLWKPAGMEASAEWLLDGDIPDGEALAGAGFNAVLRDYARIGQIMLNKGSANGKQILTESWIDESTIPTGTEPARPGRPQGYQYQWWTMPDSDAYSAKGIHGQFIYVDPETETVIARTSYWPVAWDRQLEASTLTIFKAIIAELSEEK